MIHYSGLGHLLILLMQFGHMCTIHDTNTDSKKCMSVDDRASSVCDLLKSVVEASVFRIPVNFKFLGKPR